jgi:ankyrin repeat protein
VVDRLLNHNGILINQAMNDGITPLYSACEEGHLDAVDRLLKQNGILINQATNTAATPLYIACQQGHFDVVGRLLNHNGIDINQARIGGATPLLMACHNGHTSVVRLLLDNRADIHPEALSSAKKQGHTSVVNILEARVLLLQQQQELMQGRSIILNALNATSIQAVKEVPFSYLEHISNGWELSLGSGGFGSVYRGVDSDGNFEVAIKALRSDRMTEKDVAEFEVEISVRTHVP